MNKKLLSGSIILLLAGAAIILHFLSKDSDAPEKAVAPSNQSPPEDAPLVGAAPNRPAVPSAPAPIPPPALSPEIQKVMDSLPDPAVAAAASGALLKEARLRAEADPAAALAWAVALDADSARLAASEVIDHWTATDPAAALDALFALEETEQGLRSYGLSRAVLRMASSDAHDAWAAAGRIEDPQMRTVLEGSIMGRDFAKQDPAGAAATLDTIRQSEGLPFDHLVGVHAPVATAFALEDITAAAAWVQSLPEGDARARAMQGLIGGWAATDPLAASEWLAELPGGPNRDAGIESLVIAARPDDSASALVWAGTIGDPAIRTRTVENTAYRWLSLEPEKARTWLESESGFPATEVNAILTTYRKMKDGTIFDDLEAASKK